MTDHVRPAFDQGSQRPNHQASDYYQAVSMSALIALTCNPTLASDLSKQQHKTEGLATGDILVCKHCE